MAAPRSKGASRSGLRGTRRRLSVVSDNKLIEGIATLGHVDEEKTHEKTSKSVVKCYGGVSKKGYAPYNPRKRNQDAILMEEHKPTNTMFFAVLDGHGEAGDLVSHYVTDRLPRRVFNSSHWGSDPIRAVSEETLRLEKALLADASIDTEFSGSTAVMATIRGNTLSVANIGDSRIIIGRQKKGGGWQAIEVSIDHKPDAPKEKERITKAGGRVYAIQYEDGIDGPARVWLGHMEIPGLAMSRSLGDTVAHTAGVLSEPEFFNVELTEADKIIVVASDGLWEFMTNKEVIDFICKMKEPKKAVDILVAEANARWMTEEQVIDDTTIIVAYLDVPPK